ncbi:MAG: class I SAM-dependent methyltransferase [Nitrososphaeria archaeon]
MSETYLELLEKSLPHQSHKMYNVWKSYALDAIKRGRLIREIVSEFIRIDGAKILDVGCGEGGISIALKEVALQVIGLDIDHLRVKRAKVRSTEEGVDVDFIVADGLHMPFKERFFDIVILSDIMEHVPSPKDLIEESRRVLKTKGIIYLQAPNKFSPYQIIHDGHYGLFGITLLPRRIAKWYVTKIRKRTQNYDVFELPTIWSLKRLSQNYNFKIYDCSEKYYALNYKNKYSFKILWKILLRYNPLKYLLIPTFVFIYKKL